MDKYTESFKNRFWDKIDIGDADECWEWTPNSIRRGYGVISLNGTTVNAHRAALELDKGRKLDEMALHTCDNKLCCNPDHLYEGDTADNWEDWDERLNDYDNYHGEDNNPNAKLDREDVKDIKQRLPDTTVTELANEYGVSLPTISLIKNGTNWADVKP